MSAKEIISNEEFEMMIKDGVTLVDFNAPWCAPCRSQGPIIDSLAGRMKDRVAVAAINIENYQDLAVKLGIQSIPTLIIYKNSKELQRFVGLQSESTLADALDKALG